MSKLFNPPDADEAYESWRATCGPTAFAALVGKPVMEVRGSFPGFPEREWVNPTDMREALLAAAVPFEVESGIWPQRGLVFVQFTGPWTEPDVPVAAAYRHTHWIAIDGTEVYDVNARGWISKVEWMENLAPNLIRHTPRATGWYVRLGIHCWKGKNVWRREEWRGAACNCGACHVCGFWGRAPRPKVEPKPVHHPKAERVIPAARGLFDETFSGETA